MSNTVIHESSRFTPGDAHLFLTNSQSSCNERDGVVCTCQTFGRNGIGVTHITILRITVIIVKCTAKHTCCLTIYKAFVSHTIASWSITISDGIIIGSNYQSNFSDGKLTCISIRQFVVVGFSACKCRSCGNVVACIGLLTYYCDIYLISIHHSCSRNGKTMASTIIRERCRFTPNETHFLLPDCQRTVMIGDVIIISC